MTLWSHTDQVGTSGTGAGKEYLGRSAEEAVARARAALGADAGLRCWKTRRGGVAGFFATEVFVAAVTPPAGADRTPGGKRRPATAGVAPTPAVEDRTLDTGVVDAAPVDTAFAQERPWPEGEHPAAEASDPLTALVEDTTDPVSLRLAESKTECNVSSP